MTTQILSGKYLIQDEIARGGMGVIYKALDRTLNRIVAIKQIHAHLSGDPSFAERFLREARAMARLQHDNIVTIYSVEEDQQTQFLVMEFFGPGNLRTLIRQPNRLPLRDVVHIGHQLSLALAYAHGHSIIHRDIKPANVLIDKHGKAKLTDFGIAAALDEASITSTGQVIGTPEYMSPEQARGIKLDGRSDLYSLGIIFYEMITGRPPYADTSKTAILGKLVFEQQELSLQFPPNVPSLLQGVVRDLLRRGPEERIPDADTLASQLYEILYTLPQSHSSTTSVESGPTVVSAPIKAPMEDPTRIASPPIERAVEPPTRTILQPRTRPTPVPPSPAAERPVAPPPARELDETTVLPSQPVGGAKYKAPEPSLSPPPPHPPSASLPLIPIIGGGIVLVAVLVGLISYLAPGPGSPSREETSAPLPIPDPGYSQAENNPPSPVRTAQAEELDKQREQLKEETKRLEEKQQQAEAQRANEEAERLELGRQRAIQQARDEVQKRKRVDEERVHQIAQQRALEQRPAEKEAAKAPATVEAEGPKNKVETVTSPPAPSVPPSQPPLQIAKVFPDAQLRSLLEKFKDAYERCDLDAVQSLSRMSENRLSNVEFMFSNYTAFTASIQNITKTEQGATAVLVLETGTRSNGETIAIPAMGGKFALQIPRRGNEWDKVMW